MKSYKNLFDKIYLIYFLTVFIANFCSAQEKKTFQDDIYYSPKKEMDSISIFNLNTPINYKYSKITLSSGETVKAKNVTLTDNNISFLKYNSTSGQKEKISYNLSEIPNFQVAKKNNAFSGLLIGTGVGILTMVIVEQQVEKPKSKTSTISGPGYTSTTTVTETKIMAPGPKLVIVAGGSLLGTIIGASIKKGWKTVFPTSSSMINNVDLHFALNYKYSYQTGLSIKYKF